MIWQKPVFAGNWKLNHGPSEAKAFLHDFLPRLRKSSASGATVVLFPPALSLAAAREVLGSSEDILLGVQNVHWESHGAFTGELSAPMARAASAQFVLVGHSERRHLFGETDEDTLRKVRAVLDAQLLPTLCVGETLEEREAGRALNVVERQLEAVAAHLAPDEVSRLLIAYEPVWAIGTGRTATPKDASDMHRHLRARLQQRFGRAGDDVPLLYGGSVKPENAGELLAEQDIDGVLVGGASLDPESFLAICESA